MPLIILVLEAKLGDRSWMQALVKDLVWLQLCDSDANFDVRQWFQCVRAEPARARNLVRKVCSSSKARSVTLSETGSAIQSIQAVHTCFCGMRFRSKATLDGHRGTHHGVEAP